MTVDVYNAVRPLFFGAGQAMQDASQRPGGKAGEASKGSNGAAASKLGQVLAALGEHVCTWGPCAGAVSFVLLTSLGGVSFVLLTS